MSGDWVEVTTQAQLDALKPGDVAIVRSGHFYASGSASVTAYGSASVTAYDSASVTASGSASVTAYDSASVTAYDSASVRAYGSASVTASSFVAVHRQSTHATIQGGVLITPPDTETCDAPTWLDYYGVKVTKAGYAVLFKAVNDSWQTNKGPRWTYSPGATVTPERWDAGRFCGDGLHLCARPELSARYYDGATKFVAVRVKAADIVPLGDKVKTKECRVLYEVDIHGERIVRGDSK
ncbi:MAG: DUF7666 domain-containing protein [Mycobacteriaceae bacterium]